MSDLSRRNFLKSILSISIASAVGIPILPETADIPMSSIVKPIKDIAAERVPTGTFTTDHAVYVTRDFGDDPPIWELLG